ncbi:MAG: TonB-dependent receptor [Arcobacteraceae bacterium]|nr:TonB-dependent receptor [Arcobacteraceae bacterium]
MTNTIKLSLVASLFCTATINANEGLGTITVSSATKSEQSIKDVTSNVEVITSIELEEKNIKTVTEALNLVSGVSFTSNGGIGATTSLSLRGMNGDNILILIDGIKFQDPSNTGGANIAHLMVNNIEKIEIIKGAQSGIWGSNATAGVINIITKKAKDGFHGSILVEAGSFKTKKIGAVVSYKNNKFDTKISASNIKSDGFTTQAPKGKNIDNYEDDGYENTTLNLQGNYYINDNSKVGINITDIDALKEYDSFNTPNDTTIKSDIDTTLYGVSYNQILDKHNLTFKVEKSDFKRDEIGTVSTMFGAAVKNFNGETTNIEINDNFKYNNDSFLLIGLGSSSDEVDYKKTDATTNKRENKNKFGYLTNSNSFDKTILTQSLRYDQYNNFDNKFTGKIGIKHNYNQDLFISSNIGTAYNVPNIMEELNPWGTVNEDLNPENSKSGDISLGYKDFKVTYFYTQIKDLIDWNNNRYENLKDKSTFQGIELDYKKTIIDNILISLNYTRLRAKDNEKKDLAGRAKQTFKFGLDYYVISKLHIGLNGEYVGERKEYNFDGSFKAQTGKYTIAHLNINYDLTKEVKIYGKIENITDKYYQTIDGFTSSPRAFYAGVKYSF